MDETKQVASLEDLCDKYDLKPEVAHEFVYYRLQRNGPQKAGRSKTTFANYRKKYESMEPRERALLIAAAGHELLANPPEE